MASALVSVLSVILCAMALILYSSPADAQADCCLSVSHKPIPKRILLTHRKQFKVDGCSLDAVVFVTRKGLNLCAPPAAEEHWVKEAIKFLDTRLKKCKEEKFYDKRCDALKKF